MVPPDVWQGPGSTATPDKLRARHFALLSDKTLRQLGNLAAAMVANRVRHTVEEVVVAVLAEATGGELPLAAEAWPTSNCSPCHLDCLALTLQGRRRRVGDAMQTQQLRLAWRHDSWGVAAELAADLRQNFKHARRYLWIRKAEALGYLRDALVMALNMHAMKRWLVFSGCVGPDM